MTSSDGRPRRVPTAAAVAAIAAVCLGMVAARVIWSSAALLRAGEAALSAGRSDEGARLLGRAARMYAPGNPYSQRALDGLMALGAAAEGRGDRPLALLAFREARSAILATRSIYTPSPALLALANAHLARLMAEEEAGDPGLGKEPFDARAAWHARALQRDEAPRVGWTLLALLGAALFIGAGFGLALRAVSESGRLVRRPALRWALLSLLGLLLMCLGLWRA